VSKILIVDDDETMTNLLQTLVMMEGHAPTIVNDSRKAMEMVRSVDPELILLDLMMPGLSGFELCALLQRDPKFANIPIIVVSARDDVESKKRALRAGAKDYLTKPFDANELLQKIRELTRANS
jgi:DNA-binding response OmpR family regulator